MHSGDLKSGARLERVVVDGQPHVVKYLHVDEDWLMRATGDLRGHPIAVWRSGILDAVPTCIDHAVVGAAGGSGRNGWGGALLMRDVSAYLVPEGDRPVSVEQHLRFLDHSAALHAAFMGWSDTVGLVPVTHRYLAFSPHSVKVEAANDWRDVVPPLIMDGRERFDEVAGDLAGPVAELLLDPEQLADARAMPKSMIRGPA
jgi:hypothetical protein